MSKIICTSCGVIYDNDNGLVTNCYSGCGGGVFDIYQKVVNLTPHAVVITDGPTFKPSGQVARVESLQEDSGTINGIPVKTQRFGDIIDLPNPQDDTVFIVSAIVLAAAKDKGRTDVVAPDTSNAVRDDNGHIVSVPGFVK